MSAPFCEILCSPEAAKELHLKRRGWVCNKAGFGFENWVLRKEPKRKYTIDLKGRLDVAMIRFS